MNTIEAASDLNRRDFIRGSSFAAAMLAMGAVPIQAADVPQSARPAGADVNFGVIGCGAWGREILATLAKLPNAPVVAVCDHYKAFLDRAKTQLAPKAETYAEYQKLLGDKNVKAVVVATPSHLHKQITLDALAAGKHVYCEAPVATTIEDSRAIAQAALNNWKLHFQPGILYRSDPQMRFLLDFVRTGSTGRPIKARSQWHKQNTWRKSSPNEDREKELNWRLDKNLSIGLVGEIGIQQLDVANWFYRANPIAVTGFGAIAKWTDEKREVPDSIQTVFEYPEDVLFNFEATLGNSFDGMLDVYYGAFATLMIRDGRAWMFKEPDAPLLGWEVYAQKNSFYKETGISLVTGASKLDKQLDKVTDPRPDDQGPLFYALQAFIRNTNVVHDAVTDFISSYGSDEIEAMKMSVNEARKAAAAPAAGALEGHEATVAVIKANEAVMKRQRIVLAKEWFNI